MIRGTVGPQLVQPGLRRPLSRCRHVGLMKEVTVVEEMAAIHELDGKDSHVPNSSRHCHRCWPHTPGREAKSRPSMAQFNGASRLAEN